MARKFHAQGQSQGLQLALRLFHHNLWYNLCRNLYDSKSLVHAVEKSRVLCVVFSGPQTRRLS